MRGIAGSFCAFVLALLAQGCAGIPYQTYDLVDDIAEDQASLNDAYGRALNGQILLNVLRSRDRWPRHYTNVSPISDQPTIQTSGTSKFSPLGIGNPANPFGGSEVSLSHEESTRPSYGVQPLDSEAINRAVLSPTKRSTFEHYWSGDWPRDVLLMVMVSSISRSTRARASEEGANALSSPAEWNAPLVNGATQLQGGCAPLAAVAIGHVRPPTVRGHAPPAAQQVWPDDPSGACAFYQLAHELADYSGGLNNELLRLRRNPSPNCEHSEAIVVNGANQADLIGSLAALSDVAGNRLSVRLHDPDPVATRALRARGAAPPARATIELANCPPEDAAPVLLEVLGAPEGAHNERPVVATYYLELRSLDAMVYAMGEVLRPVAAVDAAHPGHENGDVGLARAPCGDDACELTPLFRVIPRATSRHHNSEPAPSGLQQRTTQQRRAAEAHINDQDYAAVVVHRGERYFAGPPVANVVANDMESGDRTATVLTLLTQLYALNNSPGALASIPARPVID